MLTALCEKWDKNFNSAFLPTSCLSFLVNWLAAALNVHSNILDSILSCLNFLMYMELSCPIANMECVIGSSGLGLYRDLGRTGSSYIG